MHNGLHKSLLETWSLASHTQNHHHHHHHRRSLRRCFAPAPVGLVGRTHYLLLSLEYFYVSWMQQIPPFVGSVTFLFPSYINPPRT